MITDVSNTRVDTKIEQIYTMDIKWLKMISIDNWREQKGHEEKNKADRIIHYGIYPVA